MREKFKDLSFHDSSNLVINQANDILISYAEQGLSLTLRQLFYQFVARGFLKNTQKNYKRLGEIITNGRLAGLIDWRHIVDLTRFLRTVGTMTSAKDAIDQANEFYLEDKWADQDFHIEVWIEKDALAGVFQETCEEMQVALFSCRGYTSQTEMYNAAKRLRYYESLGKFNVILHFGDHDPSGMHMTEDIIDRLAIFNTNPTVDRIALNMQQIKEYNPPPNFAKVNDPRAEKYIIEYGEDSWELDALEPMQLRELVRRNVLEYRDEDLWELALEREQVERKYLAAYSNDFMGF